MFKPSTVLIQADINGGNNNLFDAVQDYLIQSCNKNKNSIQNKFQTENETYIENGNEIEIENEIEKIIDNNQVELNKNKKSKILSRSILTRYKVIIELKNDINNQDGNVRDEQNLENFEYLKLENLAIVNEEKINEDVKNDLNSVSTELYLIHRYVTILQCTTLYYLFGLVLSLLVLKYCVIFFFLFSYLHFIFSLLPHFFLYYRLISFNLFN